MTKEMGMHTPTTEMHGFQRVLEQEMSDLVRVLRKRDGIVIEKSADQMDSVQFASERDMAIRNVDRDSRLLRQVRAASQRIADGTFGICIECEQAISPKRLAALPWAPRCLQCQEIADQSQPASWEIGSGMLAEAR
jgi:DnaK suppressor protein